MKEARDNSGNLVYYIDEKTPEKLPPQPPSSALLNSAASLTTTNVLSAQSQPLDMAAGPAPIQTQVPGLAQIQTQATVQAPIQTQVASLASIETQVPMHGHSSGLGHIQQGKDSVKHLGLLGYDTRQTPKTAHQQVEGRSSLPSDQISTYALGNENKSFLKYWRFKVEKSNFI